MKRVFLTIVACAFAFVCAQAQNSAVETASQLTKAEQFKARNGFIKETTIYEDKTSGQKLYAKLFTDLQTGEQLTALEFWPTLGQKLLTGGLMNATGNVTSPIVAPLGYLDMDQVDDLLLALDKILTEYNNSDKKDKFSITYTAIGGIDVFFVKEFGTVTFRKKWHKTDEYGTQTVVYSEATSSLMIANLSKLIASIKEAKTIANQALEKK